jgi:ribosomal protein S18 acetylase RimI-like enzyme
MSDLIFRRARRDDIAVIVAMLADDPLGSARETPDDLAPYETAFALVDDNPNQELVVVERDGQVVGTAQVSFMAGLSHRGMWRAEIEAVRVRTDQRSSGIGAALIRHCIDRAQARGCGLIQLTSNAQRTEARRFYERLGFTASHTGFKLNLAPVRPAGGEAMQER